jgi:CPA1 family monovalent cation:H+ antiporter
MTFFQICAILLTLTAIGGYLNHKYTKLPVTIGHMAFALLVSFTAIAMDKAGLIDTDNVREFVERIDFSDVLLHGMLSFLLFAGALHINLSDLKEVKWTVGILATIGVALATFIIGTLVWYAAQLCGLSLPYIYALIFGALIAPTDPIAVLAMLKQAKASKRMYVKIGGESLFNDGVGVVVFLTLLGIALGGQETTSAHVIRLFAQEAIGGLILGSLLGWLTFRLLRSIDEYKVEVLLTLALVTGGYAIAEYIHVSAPICMVVAGLVIGNHGRSFGMSDTTRQRLDEFWELIDEIMNAVLFMLIGLEVIILTTELSHIILGILAILIVLIGRLIGIALPISFLALLKTKFERGTIGLLTWGGLRGGLSIAMALSLPMGPEKSIIVPITYIVVLFSILVQGLTFTRAIKILTRS